MLVSLKSENRLKSLYALPAFVLAFPTIPVFVLLPTFYAETVGLGLATVGWAMLVLRILDVVSDPVLGWMTDHVPMRLGKRKFPMTIGAIIAGPALILLFSPPENATVFYLLLTGGALYLGWTAIQIPYLAWSVELYSGYEDRNRINALREGSGLVGIVAIGFVLLFLSDVEVISRFQILAWITVIVGVILFFPTLRYVPETIQRKLTRPGLTLPFKNKTFLRILIAWFINGLANGFPAVCLPLFLTYVLQVSEQDQALLIFMYFIFAVIGIPVWLQLGQVMDKHRVWCLSMLIACGVFLLVPILGSGDLLLFGLVCAITGFTLGSDLTLPPSMQADCADWDKYKFMKDRTASLFSYWSMATKLALGVAVGIAFPILDHVGLSGAATTVPDEAIYTLVVIYALIPIVLKLIAVGMMWNFPLTRSRQIAVKRALEKRA